MTEHLPVPRPPGADVDAARLYPRDEKAALARLAALVTSSRDAAEECIAKKPVGGVQKDSASVRFAEALFACWGNLRVEARLREILDEEIVVEAVAVDLESNGAVRLELRRSILTRDGARYGRGAMDSNIRGTIAMGRRDATLQIVPRLLWWPVFLAAVRTARGAAPAGPPQAPEAGDGPDRPPEAPERGKGPSRPSPVTSPTSPTSTPAGTPIARALAWWGARGVPESVILRRLGKVAAAALTDDDLGKLREWAAMVRDEATTVEQIFDFRNRPG